MATKPTRQQDQACDKLAQALLLIAEAARLDGRASLGRAELAEVARRVARASTAFDLDAIVARALEARGRALGLRSGTAELLTLVEGGRRAPGDAPPVRRRLPGPRSPGPRRSWARSEPRGGSTMKVTVEICVEGIASALAAAAGGADRVELCENLAVGGVTPSARGDRGRRERLTIPVHVLIRPRGGDFRLSDDRTRGDAATTSGRPGRSGPRASSSASSTPRGGSTASGPPG